MNLRIVCIAAGLILAPLTAFAQSACPPGSACQGFAAMMGGTGAGTTPTNGGRDKQRRLGALCGDGHRLHRNSIQ